MALRDQFWILLAGNLFSFIGSLLVMLFFLRDRILRRALNNHATMVLLAVVFLRSLSFLVYQIYEKCFTNYTWHPTLYFLISFFITYGLYTTQIIFVVWATFERHIFIFHEQWVRTQRQRLFFHYLPNIVLFVYCSVYFSVITFAPLCETSSEAILAGLVSNPCSLDLALIGMGDLVLHHVVSIMLIAFFSVTLIVRVIRQKQRLNQPIQWRKHRKMTIQMLFTSLFYLICDAPWTMIVFALKN